MEKERTMKSTMPSVLVVDDSPKNVDLLVNTLKNDYRLGIARNGPKALDYAEKHHPDLILLDIMMPEMDGFEVCSRLKATPKTKDIPIVFLTAMSETDDRTRGFEMGAVDYITKPFRPPEVKARIRAHLSLKEIREDLKSQNIRLERKVEALQETLTATVQTVAAATEIDEVLNTVLNRAMMTVNAGIGSIMLPDKKNHTLSIAAAVGLGESIVNGASVRIGDGIAGKVAQTGKALLVEDVEQDPVYKKPNDPKYETASFICMPLRTRGQVIGVLNLSKKADRKVFNKSDLEYLNTLLTHISFAVENATLLKEAKEATEKLQQDVNEKSIQLDQAQQQVIQTAKLSTLGELIAGVTHEIENPLNIIMGYSQLLLSKAQDEEMRRDLIKIIDGSQQAARVAKNLLSFARQESPIKRPHSINDIVSKVLEMMAYALRLNCIKVTTDLPPGLPPIMVDGNQMQQVFLNIVNNACQVMKGRESPCKLNIRADRDGEMLRVEFTDNGPGIRADQLKTIFDPFFSSKNRGKGIGLGLSTSHGIVKAQNGNFYAKSREGAGATFILELPIVPEAVDMISDI
jgi:two-component system, LuxR family, sensor kinase FixL